MKRSKVELSNLDKLYWPKERITKGELLAYYESVSDYLLPYLKGRPMSLRRHPNGIEEEGFYHKDAGDIAPSWMDTVEIPSESSGKIIHYLLCNDKNSLLFIANLGCIEMNPWNSTVSQLEKPDYLVIDIDPSENNSFDQVIEVALVTQEICRKMGIVSCCKTSGATGLHVYIPCRRKYSYDTVRDFAHVLATLIQEKLPAFTTLERSLSKRRKDQIYVDYLQNSRGQTLASAYSVRPRPGAPVSAPLEWKEVKPGLDPGMFHIRNMLKRLQKKGDLFRPVRGRGVDIKQALEKMGK